MAQMDISETELYERKEAESAGSRQSYKGTETTSSSPCNCREEVHYIDSAEDIVGCMGQRQTSRL